MAHRQTELWDRDYLDLVEPAYLQIGRDGRGEMAYGAFTANLDCGFTPSGIDFTGLGVDERDPLDGAGGADLQPVGSLNGEISYHADDETTFKAVPWQTSSTAC